MLRMAGLVIVMAVGDSLNRSTIAVLAILLLGNRETEDRLTSGRELVQDRWPAVLAGVLVAFGLFVGGIGAGGLT